MNGNNSIFVSIRKLPLSVKINIILAFSQLITAVSSVYIATLAFHSQYDLQRHQVELSQREFDLKANMEAQKKVMESADNWFRYNFDHR